MKPIRSSNYDMMRDRMELEFIKYDQLEMIRKFSLQYDKDYLYLRFIGRVYRINRRTGRVEWYSSAVKTFGDVSSTIPVFDFLPVMLQFWDADEEFGAVLKFMWDYNTTDFMHFETIAFATMHLIDRLKETMEELQ